MLTAVVRRPAPNSGPAPSEEMSQEDWDYVYGPSWPRSQANIFAGTSGGFGEGELERSDPTPGECLTPEKAPNEANPRRVVRFPTTLATIRSTRAMERMSRGFTRMGQR
jgi:hypothetical protein